MRFSCRKVIVSAVIWFCLLASGKLFAAEEVKKTDPEMKDRVVARIDGDPIMFSELEERVKGFTDKFKQISPKMKFSEDRLAKMRKDFLDRLIKEKIMQKAAASMKTTVTDADVDARIEQLQKIFGSGEAAKKHFLGGIKDMEKFRKKIAEQIRIDRFMDAQIKGKVKVTDEEVRKYYSDHSDRFKSKEQVKVRQIVWRLPAKEDKEYTAKHDKAIQEAQLILKEVNTGKDFSELAKKYSQDEKTSSKGGELGWIEKGRLADPVDAVVFSLHKGEVSKPVETPSGLIVFQCEDKKDPGSYSFDEVKDRIRSMLTSRKKSKLKDELYNQLRSKMKIEILL